MGGEAQRSRNRKPLSDLTNTVSEAQSSQSSSATVTVSESKLKLSREPERKPKISSSGAGTNVYAGDPSICPPTFRSSSISADETSSAFVVHTGLNQRQTSHKRKKKQRCTKPKQDASLQIYIQQQKAYFDEVDAFALSEEEVAAAICQYEI